MPGEDIDGSINHTEKVLIRMGHGIMIGGSKNLEFLLEFHQLKEHRFGFIGHRRIELHNGFNDVVDGIFERFSWVNWCVIRYRGGGVAGERRRKIKSGCLVHTRWILDNGPGVQGRRGFR